MRESQGSTNEPGRPDTGGRVSNTVQCTSDFRYAERPISFYYAGKMHQIRDILAESKTETGYQFTVLAEASRPYQLFYDEYHDAWHIKLTN